MVTVIPPEMNKFQAIMHQLQKGFGQTLPQAYEKDQTNKYLQMQQDLQKQTNQGVISDLEQRRGLPAGSLSAYAADPKMAEQITRPQNPAGGVTAQPVPQEVSQKIREVLKNNPEANSDQLRAAMDEAGVPPVYSNSFTENRRRAQEQTFEEKKFEEAQRKASPEYQRQQNVEKAQAQADIKYNQELQSAHKQHELKTQTLSKLEKLNEQGVTGKPYERLLEKYGLTSLTSSGRREFAADVKNLITDIRSILGAQFSQFEFQTILNAYPSPDFSKEANSAIINNLKEFEDIRDQEFKIARDLKKENKGQTPYDYQSQVNERLNEYAQSKLPQIKENSRKIMAAEYGIKPGNVLMLDPQGEPLDVSPQEVDNYLQLGATLP